MSMKKAQSAMEYLMTYGWAILIVIIVAAALYALGIFNPATYTGRVPTGFTTLGTPTDWDLNNNGEFSIILTNRLNSPIDITEVRATHGSDTDWVNTSECDSGTPGGGALTINPGGAFTVDNTIDCDTPNGYNETITIGSPTVGSTYTIEVEVSYNAGGLDHTEAGRVTGTTSQA
jgi:hypothetical protein